jgi:DMSO/TMAO reductase YedYZ molybdopterin-dependent catalytic subunit
MELEFLPAHPIPDDVQRRSATATLHIEGLVARQITLTADDLAVLSRVDLQEAFRCEEGWSVPDLGWSGMRLSDVLALAEPLPGAGFVRVCSGSYALPLALAETQAALLCDALNHRPLPLEHGAPLRLVMTGGRCFTSVKWVDRLIVTLLPGSNDAERIARARLG